jgi:hypothetical protein
MFVTPRKFFVIVGYPHTGKGKTTQQIFGRSMFFPFKKPIQTASFGKEQFVIVFPRNHGINDYLTRIQTLIQFHREADTSFFIVLNLLPGDGIRHIDSILAYFNQSAFDIHYLLLSSSWYDKKMMSAADMELFEETVKNGTIEVLDRVITKSLQRFNERVEEVKQAMLKVLEKKRGIR